MSIPKKLGPRAHVDVNDRRLKPIYESLDNGDNKKAIQEAERVLKKAKQLNCAKALKCLALIRLGRKTEARSVLAEIRKVQTSDEGTLQALTACYKELPDFEQIVHMYEEALILNPNDESNLTQLFNAYVRIEDCNNQQQVAMKLYKMFPNKTPYLFWVIMSYVMMSSKDSKAGKKLYLPLAEGMTSKYLKEAKHESESEVMVYMMILEKQKKYKEILEALKGPMGDGIVQNPKYKTLLLLRTLTILENWKELNTTYKRLLLENLDDIVWYREYLKFTLVLLGNLPELSLTTISFNPVANGNSNGIKQKDDINIIEDDSLESMVLFLASCVELSNGEGYSHRGPYLAQLELILLVRKDSSPSWKDNLASQYLDLLSNYFRLFGDKQCCFNDLKKFFDVLNDEEKTKLRGMFNESVANSDGVLSLPDNFKTSQRHIFTFQASHYLGFYESLPVDEKLDHVGTMLNYYQRVLQFGENMAATEIQPADTYVLLLAEILFNVAMETDDMLPLIRAISILETSLERSPSNYLTKLLLIKYHTTLGTLNQGYQVFETLDVKYIQYDTLGYIISNPLMKFGQFQAAKKFCDSALKFYESVQRETTDFIINCYKFGTFDKVKEFIDLKKKVTRSLQFASASVNKLMLGLISTCHDHKATEELVITTSLEDLIFYGMNCARLIDNRDFKVISDWKLFGRQKEGLQSISFEEEKTWLLLQTSILQIIWQVVKETNIIVIQQSNSNSSNDNSLVGSTSEDNIQNQFKKHTNSLESKLTEIKPSESIRSSNTLHNDKKRLDDDSSSDIENDISNVSYRLASLFERDDRHLTSFKRITSMAKEFISGSRETTYVEHFFKTPVKIFIEKKLDESFAQFVQFFGSVVDVVRSPCLDKAYVPLEKAGDVTAEGLFVNILESNVEGHFSFKEVAFLEEAILLIQHLCHLVIVFNCCDQLLQPFKIKKGKKKSKKQPEIPNVMTSYNLFSHGLVSLHSMLTAFFKKSSDKFSTNLNLAINHLNQTNIKGSAKIAVISKQGHDQLKEEMSELLQNIGFLVDRLKEKDSIEYLS